MPLTNVATRALKPRDRDHTVSDGNSLRLKVSKAGGLLFRMRFRFNGDQQQLALGSDPTVSLADARAARDEAKRLLAQGINPAAEKQARKRPAMPDAPPSMPTLKAMAQACLDMRMRLSPLVVLRSSEIRGLLWRDISWDENLIRIPGERMKVTRDEPRDHLVPLASQARLVLEEALPWSSPRGPDSGDTLIMPALRSPRRQVSESTFNAALQRMGFEVGTATRHGLRSTFST